jgi:hypothetical protein
MTTALPPKPSNEGIEARMLLAECRTPLYPDYSLTEATRCMQWMDLVLWNRVNDPKRFRRFGAKEATLLSVITADDQFRGFKHYPNYWASIV